MDILVNGTKRQVCLMKTNDYVKYMTETFVKYIDQPKEERQRVRLAKKEMKSPFLYRWFGIIPYMLISLFKKQK